MFWWETTEIGVSTRVSAHETLDSIKEPTHTPDYRNKGPLGTVCHPKACLSFDINNTFMLKQSLESQQMDLRMFKKLSFRVERGPFTPPTHLKLVGFPLTGNDVCNQKSLSETASVSNLHSPLFLSLSVPVCADTPDEFWDYEHQVDVEAFSSSTFYHLLLQQSLSVTTQLGRLTTEVFSSDFFFFFFGHCERKTTASDGYSCQHRYPNEITLQNRGIKVHQIHHSPSSMTFKKTETKFFLWPL